MENKQQKKFYQQRLFWGITVIAVIAVAGIYAVGQSSNTSTNNGTANYTVPAQTISSDIGFGSGIDQYAQALYDHLSNGNMTLDLCNTFGSQLNNQYLSAFGKGFILLQDYVYLPKKNRCLGLTTASLYGDTKNGYTSQIIDIGTVHNNPTSSAYIASCTDDRKSNPEIGTITYCDDAFGNSFKTGVYPHSMTPMLDQAYSYIQKIGEQ